MNAYSLTEKLLNRLFHVKPTPLRSGNGIPFVFLHINKTAGTSVGKAIGLTVKQHLTAREVIARIGRAKWDSAWKFAFVRNPWDRAVSLYEYRRGKDRTGIASMDLSFPEWAERVFCDSPDPGLHNNPKSFQSQCAWLKDDRGIIDIEFIGRFENIAQDFQRIAAQIAPEARLPHLNASRRRDYRGYYDADSRERVARWFAEDIDRFDYRFDG